MYRCYLDDSGTSGLPVVTLAGFVAHSDQWTQLELEADAVLSAHNVPILHAKQFHDTKPPFKAWSKTRKRSFAEELFSVAHGRMKGYSMTVRRGDFEKYKRDTGRLQTMSSISVCFSVIMSELVTSDDLSEHIKQQGIAFSVEAGNANNGGIENFFKQMADQPVFQGCLRSIEFIKKETCRAIQLADFFAFYSRRLMRNHDKFSGRLALPQCAYLGIIERHCPVWQRGGFGRPVMTGDNLRDMAGLDAMKDVMKKL